jgi:hypothetical protein
MHGQVQYYVFLLLKGRTSEQLTRIIANMKPVMKSVRRRGSAFVRPARDLPARDLRDLLLVRESACASTLCENLLVRVWLFAWSTYSVRRLLVPYTRRMLVPCHLTPDITHRRDLLNAIPSNCGLYIGVISICGVGLCSTNLTQPNS